MTEVVVSAAGVDAGLPNDAFALRPFPVRRVTRETADTFTLELDARARGGFSFVPGQFNMLYAFGAGESAISIAGHPERPETLVHTIRRVGAVTTGLARLRRGDELLLRGPYGRGFPLERARGKHLLVVAGGIGLAPLRPIVLHALSHHRDFASATLVVGARSEADLLYKKDLARWSKRMGVAVTVDRAGPEWNGHTGVVTKLLASALRAPAETLVMMCGPEVMMRFAARELAARGVSPENVLVTTERSMKCGVGLCGHCQLGPFLLCRDGPVFDYDRVGRLFTVREL